MSSTNLALFIFAGALTCVVLGIVVGRLLVAKGLAWSLKDAIGIALIGSFIAVLFILFWKEIPAKNEQLIVYMLGQLSGFVGGVISAHYVHKAGEDKLAAQRNETAQAQAEATKAVAEAVTGRGAAKTATGKEDDPVHVIAEGETSGA